MLSTTQIISKFSVIPSNRISSALLGTKSTGAPAGIGCSFCKPLLKSGSTWDFPDFNAKDRERIDASPTIQ